MCRPLGPAAAVVIACGGNGGEGVVDPVDPVNGGPPADGSVFVENRTSFDVEVAYLRPGEEGGAAIVRSVVEAGQRWDVGMGPLPAGTELKLDLVLMVPPDQGLRVRRKASVTVDGDVDVILELEDEAEPFSLRVSVREAAGA